MIVPVQSLNRSKVLTSLVVVLPLALAACRAAVPSSTASTASPTPRNSAPIPLSPSPVESATSSAAPAFHSSISVIDAATRARMTTSWQRGCPVPIKDLRYLRMSFWGFDGAVHTGEMVVNQSVANAVVKVFGKLFTARFPLRRMRLVDVYGGDDDRSMAADNTSAFNCRAVTGGTAWSQHAYGWAIDINPIQNPYVSRGGTVLPPAGAPYADRLLTAKGMVHSGDVVVRAFSSVGWRWGGSWSGTRDYQHFSATGR